jgi:hypothetical protein
MKCTTNLTSTDVKNAWSYAAIHPLHVFMVRSGTALPLHKVTVRSVLYVSFYTLLSDLHKIWHSESNSLLKDVHLHTAHICCAGSWNLA